MQVYNALYREIEQLRRVPITMATEDIEAAAKSFEAVLREIARTLSPELRAEFLRGLTPEQRLEGLDPEQRLAGLDPDQILTALSPEAREALLKRLRHS